MPTCDTKMILRTIKLSINPILPNPNRLVLTIVLSVPKLRYIITAYSIG